MTHHQDREAEHPMMLIKTRWLQLSKRGAVLGLFGIVFALLGYSFLDVPPEAAPLLRRQLGTTLRLAPIEFYGWLWMIAGVLAIIGGLAHRFDSLGFWAASFMPALWAFVYFVAAAVDHAPRAWISGALFAGMALILVVVAGMADPLDTRPHRHRSAR